MFPLYGVLDSFSDMVISFFSIRARYIYRCGDVSSMSAVFQHSHKLLTVSYEGKEQ